MRVYRSPGKGDALLHQRIRCRRPRHPPDPGRWGALDLRLDHRRRDHHRGPGDEPRRPAEPLPLRGDRRSGGGHRQPGPGGPHDPSVGTLFASLLFSCALEWVCSLGARSPFALTPRLAACSGAGAAGVQGNGGERRRPKVQSGAPSGTGPTRPVQALHHSAGQRARGGVEGPTKGYQGYHVPHRLAPHLGGLRRMGLGLAAGGGAGERSFLTGLPGQE